MREFDFDQFGLLGLSQILAVRQFIYHLLHLLGFASFLPRDTLFVRSGLRLITTFADARDIERIQNEIVIEAVHRHRVAAGVYGMLSVLLVPLSDRRRLVHVLDDLSPADSGVVGAERDLTELGCIRNDAHFR